MPSTLTSLAVLRCKPSHRLAADCWDFEVIRLKAPWCLSQIFTLFLTYLLLCRVLPQRLTHIPSLTYLLLSLLCAPTAPGRRLLGL